MRRGSIVSWASSFGNTTHSEVTEGGVTRRVARAMEELNASAPGTRVRVVRAAYHSTAGPGLPAASFLMHSSRRVISSGFNILESPTTPIKPLEIASMPLDSTPDTETANYKVTEPDDIEISEPSKWKSSTTSSVRMPSEESSSADNASIIDLDSKVHRNIRKHSHDSESSDVSFSRRHNSRLSPLLDTPAALSTLKYKSLLTGNSDWNNRRKSYSFEDTSPLSETIIHRNDTIAMESSTDSGICKSSELLENLDDRPSYHADEIFDNHERSFKDWLSKNRPSSYKRPSYRSHDLEDPRENTIALQSKGKISINVPITLESEDDYQKRLQTEDNERRIKKVGFSKTELHFAAESGRVNIIATDEKPPPSNDFRKRRSAFVPINGSFDKPVTLFGETPKTFSEKLAIFSNNAFNELDESMATTKSILKNKIPKPKPYLLGENMTFGSEDSDMINEDLSSDRSMPTAVSMINKQLQSERRYSDDSLYNTRSKHNASVINQDFRTKYLSPPSTDSKTLRNDVHRSPSPVKRPTSLQLSPERPKPKTRELRDSELTYFGINKPKTTREIQPSFETRFKTGSNGIDDFHSVKLIQQVSSSCNSETESEDKPEYANVPLKTNFAPIPIPKTRTKYDVPKDVTILRPVIEQDNEMNISETRRSKYRRHEDSPSSRSISAPPKINRFDPNDRRNRHLLHSEQKSPRPQLRRNKTKDHTMNNETTKNVPVKLSLKQGESNEVDPLYVNLSVKGSVPLKEPIKEHNSRSPKVTSKSESNTQNEARAEESKENHVKHTRQDSLVKKKTRQRTKEENNQSGSKDSLTKHSQKKKTCEDNLLKNEMRQRIKEENDQLGSKDSLTKHSQAKKVNKQRTEKLSTPDYVREKTYDVLHHGPKSSKQDSLESRSRKTVRGNHERRSRTSEGTASPKKRETSSRNEKRKEINTDTKHMVTEINESVPQAKPRNKSSSRRERSRSRTKIEMIPSDDQNSLKPKVNGEISPKHENYKSSRRNEYVINYDDKNGTVSSICKVKVPEPVKHKKYYKDNYVNDKSLKNSSQKNSLLQPEYHWITNGGINYQDRKHKRLHARTCQIL